MDVDKILMVDEEEEFSAIARLVELGRQKGYITLDDILHFFPEAEQDVDERTAYLRSPSRAIAVR